MTVSTTASREQYATDGVTTGFPIHFPFFDDGDVNAVFVDAGGGATTLALSTDFTVAGGNGAGGTLTTGSPLGAGGTLTVFRSIPFTQEDNYVENDPLPAATLEGGFDRAAMRDQQLLDGLARAMALPVTIDPAVSAVLPSPQPSLFLRWNSDGTALELASLAAAGTLVSAGISATRAGTNTTDFVTPDGLASLWQKGADIASATTLAKPADANLGAWHVITGTTQVQHLWPGTAAGESYWFECAGALPVKNGTDLVTRTGADITFSAGDRFRMVYYGAGVWKMTEVEKADGSSFAQPYSFSANKNGVNQTSITTGIETKITFSNELFDIGGYYDASNSKWTPPAGKYLITAQVTYTSGLVDQNGAWLILRKNGTSLFYSAINVTGLGTITQSAQASWIIDATGSDFFEIYVYATGAGSKTVAGDNFYTWFQGARL